MHHLEGRRHCTNAVQCIRCFWPFENLLFDVRSTSTSTSPGSGTAERRTLGLLGTQCGKGSGRAWCPTAKKHQCCRLPGVILQICTCLCKPSQKGDNNSRNQRFERKRSHGWPQITAAMSERTRPSDLTSGLNWGCTYKNT